ncbi:MAG: ferric reductase-like transmembrane domain-containing protein [Gammaproteobacteria bacterium]|nr:ferric reductase-like transmembrane domain-containing protein [Gammaproteobacteria bacterium]MDH5344708.1 ferric reductase-like transmembrane domain-containing protein [Gammaproteobacteria bacterium]
MKALYATFGAVFLLTFLSAPTMGAGWFWDAGNGLGFAAYAGLLYLTITSSRRLDVRAHQVLGYGVLFVAVAHAFWFMLGDAAVVEFMKLGAPDYMWHGIVSMLLLGILITVALVPDRFRFHRDYPAFRYWHRVVAVATIGTATYHIAVSNFYLGAWYQSLLLVLLALAVTFGREYWAKLGQLGVAKATAYVAISVVCAAIFAVVRNLPT